MQTDDARKRESRVSRWSVLAIVVGVVYALSSGPVMATGFWLREATGWDGFYAVMWLYAPLLVFGQDGVVMAYIEWWVKLFGAVGPG
jgi:hypothetical protein